MYWKNMSIFSKLGVGFGFVLILLVSISLFSLRGLSHLVNDSTEVISGNKLHGLLAAKEVDHLNWANGVNTLLTDDKVTELNIQVDETQCAFGKWLYGEGRQEAQALVPSLAPLLKEIEELFNVVDMQLAERITEMEVDHYKLMQKLTSLFLEKRSSLKVQVDGHKCALGAFFIW